MKLVAVEGKQNEHLLQHVKPDGAEGSYYYRQFKEGFGTKFVSLKTTNLVEARKRRDEIRQEWLGLKPKKAAVLLFDEHWVNFLKTKETKSPAHYQNIESRGRLKILPYFKDMLLHEINEETGKLYAKAQWEISPGRKLFNDIKALNMFFKYAFNIGAMPRRIAFEYPDPPTNKGKVYTDDEIKKLLDNSKGDMHLMIRMAVTMGMRRSEIELLSWDRVDMKNRVIHLRAQDTKIRKARSFGISKDVFEHLLIKQTINTDLGINATHVFGNPNDISKPLGRNGHKKAWATCKRDAGVQGRFHDLRHTFLTKAFKVSVNPALICEYAGLSLDEAQSTYLHLTVEDTRVVSGLVKLDIDSGQQVVENSWKVTHE